jgi:TRAP-type C4-dicarboxylate transport system permease large subunit
MPPNEGVSPMVVPMTESTWRRLALAVVVAGAAIRCYAAFTVQVFPMRDSAVVMLIIACAGIFAHAGSTLGAFDAMARGMLGITQEPWLMLMMIMALLLVAGMLLDAASIFLIFLPILIPVVNAFGWDMTWFAVLMTMNMAIGQFTPPMAVNLLVTTRIAGIGVETTVRWVLWMMFSMLCALGLVAAFPQLALWLPTRLGY